MKKKKITDPSQIRINGKAPTVLAKKIKVSNILVEKLANEKIREKQQERGE